MQLDVHNIDNEKVGAVDLPDEIFAVPVRKALLWEIVQSQLASRRRGTHAAKDRGQVRGGGAKPYKQKGTGRARQGSSRAPHFVGGGAAMGPRPRSYAYRLPRSARKTALCSALSARVKENNLMVIENFDLEAPKTKAVLSFLGKVGTHSALLVDVDNTNLRKSAQNLAKSRYLAAGGINVYDILNHEKLVLTRASLDAIVARLTGEADDGQAN